MTTIMPMVTKVVNDMAHHSYAMFDTDKSVEIEGTVKEFQWTNPHCWIR